MRNVVSSFSAALTALFLFVSAAGAEPLMVFVSIPPQVELVRRVGGDLIRVESLVRPGDDPHTFEPLPRQMAALSKARAYFALGLPFEGALLPRLAGMGDGLRVFQSDRGLEKRPMESREELLTHLEQAPEAHHETPHDHHEHEGTDPHVWASPKMLALICRNIAEDLAAVDPANEAAYRSNLEALLGEIAALDGDLRKELGAKKGMRFLVFHPSWGYFAEEYGLVQIPIEMEGKEPKGKDLTRLIDAARRAQVKALFVAPQFSDKAAQAIADETGAALVVIDPLAENWLENLRRVGEALAKAAF